MSFSRETTIWCDGCPCGSWYQTNSANVGKIRNELRAKGWTTVSDFGVKDYCPACSTRRAAMKGIAARDRDAIYRHTLKRSTEIKSGIDKE